MSNMKLHTDIELEQMYRLSHICVNQNVMDNMFNFLRLRESLAYIYNEKTLPSEVRNLWVQNLLIITASLVESLLQSSFQRLKIMIEKKIVKTSDSRQTEYLLSADFNKIPFSKLIDLADKYDMFHISKNLVSELRKLRNNIHISNSKIILDQDERLVASYANMAFEIFDHLVLSLNVFFSKTSS